MWLNVRKIIISDEIRRNRGGRDNIYFLLRGSIVRIRNFGRNWYRIERFN